MSTSFTHRKIKSIIDNKLKLNKVKGERDAKFYSSRGSVGPVDEMIKRAKVKDI